MTGHTLGGGCAPWWSRSGGEAASPVLVGASAPACAVAQASELASATPRADGAASATARAKITALDSEVPRAT